MAAAMTFGVCAPAIAEQNTGIILSSGMVGAGSGATSVIDKAFPYKLDGYDDFYSWFEDFSGKKLENQKRVDDAISAYGDFMTEEDKTSLLAYRDSYGTSLSIMAMSQYDDAVSAIIDAAKTKYDEYQARLAAQAVVAKQASSSSSGSYSSGDGSYSGDYYQFMRDGVVNANGNKYTYYSESVLPGGGLNIPGRHNEGGFVKDGDGYICVANDKPNGTVVDTPWGAGKVYDSGTSGNHYDIYVE